MERLRTAREFKFSVLQILLCATQGLFDHQSFLTCVFWKIRNFDERLKLGQRPVMLPE
jgi:hypothetical protein